MPLIVFIEEDPFVPVGKQENCEFVIDEYGENKTQFEWRMIVAEMTNATCV